MLFNSIEFAVFLPIVFAIYWLLNNKNIKIQNTFLVFASYLFYGWWDWRFLFLIAFSSFVDYFVGIELGKTDKSGKRKALLITSLFVNLGFLGFFKYFNFFAESFADAFTLLGIPFEPYRLKVILPVGISFYTFQTLSYSIDVYRKKLEPTKDVFAFLAFVSFFPQLVAGPIERATHLLPQFYVRRKFNYSDANDGMRQILWGLFKKIVIADSMAFFANQIFNNYTEYSGSTLIVGAICFTFQIYGDFSAYSDIAIGTAKLFGFQLMRNFAYPYFSRDIAEFWRRWHISLSTWFRDYLYIPLGGSRGSMLMKIRNTFIIFIVSGFWHGANWTFIIWGALNAVYFLPLLLSKSNRKNTDIAAENSFFPSFKEAVQIFVTFSLTILAWIFFRAASVKDAILYIGGILNSSILSYPEIIPRKKFLLVALFIFIEWIQRKKAHALDFEKEIPNRALRWFIYCVVIFCIMWMAGIKQEFIYFQF